MPCLSYPSGFKVAPNKFAMKIKMSHLWLTLREQRNSYQAAPRMINITRKTKLILYCASHDWLYKNNETRIRLEERRIFFTFYGGGELDMHEHWRFLKNVTILSNPESADVQADCTFFSVELSHACSITLFLRRPPHWGKTALVQYRLTAGW